MIINFILFFIILILMFVLMIFNLILSKKMFKNREKMSPFECGFDPMSSSRMPFSLQFYLISLIFLIFDVEIAVILPMILSFSYMMNILFINFLIIMLILLIGLYIEWKEGALKWFN